MHDLFAWLIQLSPPMAGGKGGWHPQFWYVFLCVAGPVSFGITVGGLLTGIEKVFGIKLSSKGH